MGRRPGRPIRCGRYLPQTTPWEILGNMARKVKNELRDEADRRAIPPGLRARLKAHGWGGTLSEGVRAEYLALVRKYPLIETPEAPADPPVAEPPALDPPADSPTGSDEG